MADTHANFAYGTVLTAPTPAASGVTIVLNAGQGASMPAVPFNATVWPVGAIPLNSNAEIVRVTARTVDTLTATRAQEGTAARTIVVGDQFAATITAKTLTDAELVVSDGVNSVTSGTLRYSAANGIGIGINGSTITFSHNAITTGRASNDAIGLNTAQTNVTWTANSSGLSFNAAGYAGTGTSMTNASATLNSNGLQLSVAPPGVNFSAGVSNLGNTGGNTGVSGTRLVFVGSQNITLNQATDANGATISISGGAGAAGNTGYISAGGVTASLGTVAFRDLNGVSFQSTTGQAFQITHDLQYTSATSAITSNALHTSASRVFNIIAATNAAGAGTASLSSNVSFSNANGATFYTSAGGAVVLSYTVPAGGGAAISGGANSQNTGTVNFANSNGVTFGLSNNGTMTASHNGLTTARASNDAVGLATAATAVTWTVNSGGISLNAGAYLTTAMQSNAATISNINISAGTTSTNASAFTFANANGVSFGLGTGASAGSVTASHNGLTTARASNDAIGLGTAQTNVTWTVNSGGLSVNAAGYAGTGTTFAGANMSASFTFNSAGLNMSASVAAPGAAVEVNPMHLLGANTAGNTTATGSTIGWSGLNLTLSGTNASQIVVSAPATSSLSATGQVSISVNGSTISIGVPAQVTMSGFNPYQNIEMFAGAVGAGTLQFDHARVTAPAVAFDRVLIPTINTNATNSSGSHTVSYWVGVYSKNVSTLSLVHSASASTAVTHSGTVGSYSLFSGVRLYTIGMTTTLTRGDYWIGFVSRTTSGGANGSYSNLIASNIASNFLGHFGSAHNTTAQMNLGRGVYTASTSGIPGSVGFSQIRGSDSQALRPVYVFFANGTV